ncbi:MAG: exodeoxyribonuclease III [Alphaproteobacteria bacterium]
MRIVSWNINSIRIRFSNFINLKDKLDPDVICLQETKVIDELFPYQFFIDLGYIHLKFCGEKSYNGVAIISKFPLDQIICHKFAHETDCRHISAIVNGVELHNFYVPAGGDEPDRNINPKFDFKLNYLDQMNEWFLKERTRNHKMILVGDLNVAPLEQDVWSHKQLLNVVSHTPIEVEKLLSLKNGLDWCDTHREFVPSNEKLYSWWSYRNKDWEKSNRGRRLDHIWISQNLRTQLLDARILREARNWPSPSDHVPIFIDIVL